jgi:hypothetical protein
MHFPNQGSDAATATAIRQETGKPQQGAGRRNPPHNPKTPALAHCSQPNGTYGDGGIASGDASARSKPALFGSHPVDEQRHGGGLRHT